MSLAKLTSLSTQTLTLLLERQRLQTMSQLPPAATTQHIVRNLNQLRTGILAIETKALEDQNNTQSSVLETVDLLRNQFSRMKDMLGTDGDLVEAIPISNKIKMTVDNTMTAESPPPVTPQKDNRPTAFIPYSDEPPPSPDIEPSAVLEQQRLLMEEQDAHLDQLTDSVRRQHHISLQINDELGVHHGLLSELEHDLDGTQGRLSGARKRLDKFRKGVKGNLSTYIIGGLIFLLLLLIIIFKT